MCGRRRGDHSVNAASFVSECPSAGCINLVPGVVVEI